MFALWRLALVAAMLVIAASASAAVPASERNALLALYNATGGAQWSDHDGWNGAPGTECQWSGVICNDAQTTVTELQLCERGLNGTLPQAIADLTNLTNLSLCANQLHGSIPDGVASLTALTSLDLSSNQFTGAIPPSVGQLSRLEILNLNDNALSGEIPQTAGNLAGLRELDLYANQFTGTIPSSLFALSSLEVLVVEGNQLSGPLPPDVSRLASLQLLDVASNQFSGAIPPQITSMTSLRDLNLNGNRFTGTLPADIDRLVNLQSLDVGDNQLGGTIPGAISRMTTLQTLSGYGNGFTGSLPPLDALTKLERLDFHDNQLSGPLPDLRALTALRSLSLGTNSFTGTIPDMFGSMAQVQEVVLDTNALTGGIPPSLMQSVTLGSLSLAFNQLTGEIPANIGGLKSLAYLDLQGNRFSGPIPDSLWDLADLVDVRLAGMALTGVLSPRIANLTGLQVLAFGDNELSGSLPPQIGALTALQYLSLGANRFSGAIPSEIGQLRSLLQLDLAENALSGALPAELANLTSLENSGSSLDYNRLFTNDPALRAFINQKMNGNDFEATQTVTPVNVTITATTDRSATVQWTPIAYQNDEGGYQVAASLTAGGTPVAITTTSSKEISSAVLRGLQAETSYFISVAAVTYPHDTQRNLLLSDAASAVQAATGPRVLAPAEVIVTAEPHGLVEVDGVSQGDDSFAVTNFGDVATSLTLYKSDDDFFTYAPQTFTLAAGATQSVTIKSVQKPAGTYWGSIGVTGDGAAEDLGVSVSLLSAARPPGSVIAEPLAARVEISGLPGTDSIATATFRNRGTADLTGIAVGDVPWIVPKNDPITICSGCTGSVTFTIDRSRRPDANGALSGTLSLIYVAGNAGLSSLGAALDAGVNVSKVTVVDIAKPPVAPGTIPPLDPKEVAYFVPGLASLSRNFGSIVSDLALANAFGTARISDLRLYYTSSVNAQTSVASVAPVAGNQSINLVNVGTTVYGSSDPSASLQVRTADWQKLIVAAHLLSLNSVGTFAGDVPVFRSDRGAAAGEQTYLTGMTQGGTLRSTLYLQETSGAAASAHIEMLDAAGATVATRDVSLAPFAMSAISDLVADRTVSAVVTTTAGSAGSISAYARMLDDATGESWSIVDWSRYYDYKQSEVARLPLVSSSGGSVPPGRRRAVPHAATASRSSTQLSLFNPAAADARVNVKYVAAGGTYAKEVALAPRQTISIADVAALTGGPANGDGTLLLDPERGRFIATGRISTGGAGTSVPVIAAQSGLRVGQSQIFSGLEDSTAATVAAAKPATYRTTFGFLETANAPATVQVTILLSDGRSLVSTVITRHFDLAPGQLLVLPDMVKSIIGSDRDSRYPDLHNLQLQVAVSDGAGAVVPFVIVTDNASGDGLLRLQ